MVFDGRGDDMLPGRHMCGCISRATGGTGNDAKNREIVRLSSAAREDDLARPCSEKPRHGFTGRVYRASCPLAVGMYRTGIAKILGEIGHHRGEDSAVHGSRCVVVQVHTHFWMVLLGE